MYGGEETKEASYAVPDDTDAKGDAGAKYKYDIPDRRISRAAWLNMCNHIADSYALTVAAMSYNGNHDRVPSTQYAVPSAGYSVLCTGYWGL